MPDPTDFDDLLAPPPGIDDTEQPSVSLEDACAAACANVHSLEAELSNLEAERERHLANLADPAKAGNAQVHMQEVLGLIRDTKAKLVEARRVRDDQVAVHREVEVARRALAKREAKQRALVALDQLMGDNVKDMKKAEELLFKLLGQLAQIERRAAKVPALVRDAGLHFETIAKYLDPSLPQLGLWGAVERARRAGQFRSIPGLFNPVPPAAYFGRDGGILRAHEYAELLAAGLGAHTAAARAEELNEILA